MYVCIYIYKPTVPSQQYYVEVFANCS